MPHIHGAEVRAVGARVADAIDERDFAIIPKLLDGSERGIKAELVVKLKHLVLRDVDEGPVVVILPVVIRNDRVQGIVAARKLQDYHRLVVMTVAISRHVLSPIRILMPCSFSLLVYSLTLGVSSSHVSRTLAHLRRLLNSSYFP